MRQMQHMTATAAAGDEFVDAAQVSRAAIQQSAHTIAMAREHAREHCR